MAEETDEEKYARLRKVYDAYVAEWEAKYPNDEFLTYDIWTTFDNQVSDDDILWLAKYEDAHQKGD